MSDAKAIAAVTATLANLLQTGIGFEVAGAQVTTKPPDRMADKSENHRLNVFLYQTAVDAAWRNEDPPGTRPGEEAWPALPLRLHYLVTPYPLEDDGLVAHRLLGQAMLTLHDHPLLGAQEIHDGLGASTLDQQVERVRITPHALTVDELSKLWTTFQSQFRVSAAYEACVVLIQSRRVARTTPPVLERNPGDTGPIAQAGNAPLPAILAVVPPANEASAVSGERVLLRGTSLEATDAVELAHPRLDAPVRVVVDPADVTPEAVTFTVPPGLPAGVCGVRALGAPNGPAVPTAPVALALAPAVANAVAVRGGDVVTVKMDVTPPLVPGQEATLYLDRAIVHPPVAAPAAQLQFSSADVAARTYPLWVRVDGVDNRFLDRTAVPPQLGPGEVQVP